MHEAQTSVVTGAGHPEREWLSINEHLGTRVRVVVPGNHFDHRRLAAAVLADQRPDLARFQFQVEVDQRSLTGEGLGKPANLQGWRLRHLTPSELTSASYVTAHAVTQTVGPRPASPLEVGHIDADPV